MMLWNSLRADDQSSLHSLVYGPPTSCEMLTFLLVMAIKRFVVTGKGSQHAEWKKAEQCEQLVWAITLIGKVQA